MLLLFLFFIIDIRHNLFSKLFYSLLNKWFFSLSIIENLEHLV